MGLAQLVDVGGSLYMPNDMIIVHRYPEGDYDTIAWPFEREEDKRNLRTYLYCSREMGELPSDARAVLLPNGEVFEIDAAD